MGIYTVFVAYINTMKTTFDLSFNLYQAFKELIDWIHIPVNLKSFSLIICKRVIRRKLVNNQNINRKVVFIVLTNVFFV